MKNPLKNEIVQKETIRIKTAQKEKIQKQIMWKEIVQKEKIQKELQGSYTVEAALIMPIIVLVVIALCYMSFYIHDKIRIQSILNAAVLKSNLYIRHLSDFYTGEIDYSKINDKGVFYYIKDNLEEENKVLKTYLTDELQSGLFFMNLKSVSVDLNYWSIKVHTTLKLNFPFRTIKSYFSERDTVVELSSMISVHNPPEFVRGYTAMDEIMSGAKGYNKVKDKLSSILASTALRK
jgi:Flp pilus assembly protein TadG